MEFKREKFEKKGILKDVVSIPGTVNKSAKKCDFCEVMAYNDTDKTWVKYDNGTHNTGLFLLGILKKEDDFTSANKKVAILVQGEVDRKDVTAVASNEKLVALLGRQGIFVL